MIGPRRRRRAGPGAQPGTGRRQRQARRAARACRPCAARPGCRCSAGCSTSSSGPRGRGRAGSSRRSRRPTGRRRDRCCPRRRRCGRSPSRRRVRGARAVPHVPAVVRSTERRVVPPLVASGNRTAARPDAFAANDERRQRAAGGAGDHRLRRRPRTGRARLAEAHADGCRCGRPDRPGPAGRPQREQAAVGGHEGLEVGEERCVDLGLRPPVRSRPGRCRGRRRWSPARARCPDLPTR